LRTILPPGIKTNVVNVTTASATAAIQSKYFLAQDQAEVEHADQILGQCTIPISSHVISKFGEQESAQNQDVYDFKSPHPLFSFLSFEYKVRGHQESNQINGPTILQLGFLPP